MHGAVADRGGAAGAAAWDGRAPRHVATVGQVGAGTTRAGGDHVVNVFVVAELVPGPVVGVVGEPESAAHELAPDGQLSADGKCVDGVVRVAYGDHRRGADVDVGSTANPLCGGGVVGDVG